MKKIMWGVVVLLWCIVWFIPAMFRIREPKFTDKLFKKGGIDYE